MKRLTALLTAFVMGAMMLCGCGNTAEEDPIVSNDSAVTSAPVTELEAETTEATTSVAVDTAPVDTEATTEATTTAAEASTTLPADSAINYSSHTDDEVVQKFAFNIFSEVVEGGENSVFSPLSAYYALGMLSLGATDESAEELQGLFGMTAEEAAAWCSEIMQEYAALSDDSTTVLSVSNGVFIDDRMELVDGSDFTFSNLEKYYEAECKTMRLSTDATREYINSWISSSTDGLIPSLLSENLDDQTVMVLINALLLDAEWANPFDFFGSYYTTDFTTSSGEIVQAEYFGDERNFDYIKYDGVTGIIMDYADGRLKYVALMPDDGDIDGFIDSLTAERFNELLSNVQNGLCNMHIPRYKIEAEMELDEALTALGLGAVYSGGFDNFGEGIFLSKTIQKAAIEVDVWGTKAAAVTAEVMFGAALTYPEVIEFNQSFFYAVYDSETGVPLFMGVVDNPTE
ncbi:MAG: hypothetical protein LUH23_08835 [Oscillospiraceae bacterium]|nr:hypothetical protein [Oscillospiraceae bacterium]